MSIRASFDKIPIGHPRFQIILFCFCFCFGPPLSVCCELFIIISNIRTVVV